MKGVETGIGLVLDSLMTILVPVAPVTGRASWPRATTVTATATTNRDTLDEFLIPARSDLTPFTSWHLPALSQ